MGRLGWDVNGDDLPMVKIPNRDYWLFRGALTDLGDWGSAVRTERYETVQNPAFMWPADQAWCVTGDVDPHFPVIAGPAEAIDLLIADPRLDAVVDDPNVPPPRYF